MPGVKSFAIKTFGCQMNVYDSERIGEQLEREGLSRAADPAAADLLVLNTCHIREKAVEKVYSDLGRIREMKEAREAEGRSLTIAVTGCIAQAEGEELARRAPEVDLVVGPQSLHRLPALLAAKASASASPFKARKAEIATDFEDNAKFKAFPARARVAGASAFLTVQEGCDRFCTFCVVPYTRGMELSRPVAEVLAEARELISHGAREITLLGQNVNAYHGLDETGAATSLAGLIRRLSALDGLERIRYTTSHPRDMGDDLIAAHAREPKLMPYLHLPVQSGSDRVLAAMNRKHTADDYRRLIDRIRRARLDIALSTDVIVGFPGETDAEFEATLDLVREIGFLQAFAFKYSARPGTPAANIEEQVAGSVKARRLAELQDVLDGMNQRFNDACVGRVLKVLFDKPGRRSGELVGRSPYLQAVTASAGREWLGRIADVKVAAAGPYTLSGEIEAA